MIDHFIWPGFDRADAFRLHKVVNEPDFFPLHLAASSPKPRGCSADRRAT
jgi:hypothetical protein